MWGGKKERERERDELRFELWVFLRPSSSWAFSGLDRVCQSIRRGCELPSLCLVSKEDKAFRSHNKGSLSWVHSHDSSHGLRFLSSLCFEWFKPRKCHSLQRWRREVPAWFLFVYLLFKHCYTRTNRQKVRHCTPCSRIRIILRRLQVCRGTFATCFLD